MNHLLLGSQLDAADFDLKNLSNIFVKFIHYQYFSDRYLIF
jgi:hypothetical protein